MIRFILCQNRQGKTRLSRWYVPFTGAERAKVESDVHRALMARDPRFTNFLDYRNYKLIYRRYAGLYFCFCVDLTDNELGTFELIHLFVELLDSYFGNVCELDLVFKFEKVYQILDELILGGELVESATANLVPVIKAADKLE